MSPVERVGVVMVVFATGALCGMWLNTWFSRKRYELEIDDMLRDIRCKWGI